MIRFKAVLQKFNKQGEKTGWTYVLIPAETAQQLQPGKKTSFRVKGKIDAFSIAKVSLLPMGEGDFIMAINADMRKGIKKRVGDTVSLQLAIDSNEIEVPAELTECFEDEPSAKKFFETLTKGHKNYFLKWLSSAKTEATKTKRIAEMINALSKKQGFPEMLRSRKEKI